MNTERLAANVETRTFYFHIVDQKPNEIKITMYGTPYTFVKLDDEWQNGPSNLMNMSKPLIDAVMDVIFTTA